MQILWTSNARSREKGRSGATRGNNMHGKGEGCRWRGWKRDQEGEDKEKGEEEPRGGGARLRAMPTISRCVCTFQRDFNFPLSEFQT